jgi:hypothetical protein
MSDSVSVVSDGTALMDLCLEKKKKKLQRTGRYNKFIKIKTPKCNNENTKQHTQGNQSASALKCGLQGHSAGAPGAKKKKKSKMGASE